MKTFVKKHASLNRGFTIIETLVAITILMISIVGPLTIASKSLTSAVYAHDQVTASYLAQDAMEYLKNVRDNNFAQYKTDTSVDWLEGLRNCTQSAPCSVDTINKLPDYHTDASLRGISAPCDASCILYKGPAGYAHDAAQTKTQFSRSFYISDITDDEAKLAVQVDWKNGLVLNQVLYENEIFNIK